MAELGELLERKIAPPKPDTLYDACRRGDVGRLQEYCGKGGVVDDFEPLTKMTLMHSAAFGGSAAIVDMLVEKGANVDAADNDGWAPLHYACRAGHPHVVQSLVTGGANVNARNASRSTPLHICACGDRPEHMACAELLLQHGASWKVKNVAEMIPEQTAVANNNAELAKVFRDWAASKALVA